MLIDTRQASAILNCTTYVVRMMIERKELTGISSKLDSLVAIWK